MAQNMECWQTANGREAGWAEHIWAAWRVLGKDNYVAQTRPTYGANHALDEAAPPQAVRASVAWSRGHRYADLGAGAGGIEDQHNYYCVTHI